MTHAVSSDASSGAIPGPSAAGTGTGTAPARPGPAAGRSGPGAGGSGVGGLGVGDEVSLVPAGPSGTPMAAPVGAWGLLVIGVDLARAGSGRVESFIGFFPP